jgi:hypothetical protein
MGVAMKTGKSKRLSRDADEASWRVVQVKRLLAQVKPRRIDVLMQWWLQHGRIKCFNAQV